MAKAIDSQDTPSDKLGKLLPSEVTGLYVSLRALFADVSANTISDTILIALAIVSLVICIAYIVTVRGVRNVWHVVVYAVTFVIWALTLDPDRLSMLFPHTDYTDYFSRILAAVSLLWAFVIPWAVPARIVSSTNGTG